MADVSIIDIGGVQWNIKDKEARDKITVIENAITFEILEDPTFLKIPNISFTVFQRYNHYRIGKIHFLYLRFQNINGGNIGTTNPTPIAKLNIGTIKQTSFKLYNDVNKLLVKCSINTDGIITIEDSSKITKGDNLCSGQLIFEEA